MQTITICTDAGHKNWFKKSCAVWACYIRTPSQTIHASGIIKQPCKGSSQAELYAIANALFILSKRYDLSKYKLILYSDSRYALKNHLDGSFTRVKNEQKQVYNKYIKPHLDRAQKYEARWVKAHLSRGSWSTASARHFMQNWCDEEVHRIMPIACKIAVEEYNKKACVLPDKRA